VLLTHVASRQKPLMFISGEGVAPLPSLSDVLGDGSGVFTTITGVGVGVGSGFGKSLSQFANSAPPKTPISESTAKII